MASPPFVHLHAHSQYSLLDGVSHFEPLFERVKELGMDTIALTDHGNLFGALQFTKQAKKAGVRPIVGCECYVSPTNRHDRTSPEARRTRQHLVLLSTDYEGYLNLSRLVSKGFLEGFYYNARIDKEILAQHSKGLIALSGCLSGVVADYLRIDRQKDAEQSADDFAQIMGPDNFYIELMDHGLREQKEINRKLIELAKRMNLPMVATNDCHYIRREDARTQDLLMAIGTNKSVDEENRFRYTIEELYVKSAREMEKLFGEVPGAIENTVRIAERCRSEIKTRLKLLPQYRTPQGEDPAAYLRGLVAEGLKMRYGDVTEAIRERAEFEVGVIEQMGYVDYFLVVWDFINYAKKSDIAVGPGRGSGAGSIVAYALEITDLDPLKYKLFFERFLNPERVSMPDFDIDFCPLGREEVVSYVRKKYGEGNVANIITFNTMKAKAAVRDTGRVMGLPLDQVDRVAKMIPEGPKATIAKSLEESADLRDLYNSDPQIKDLIDRAKRIEGTVRQPGMHAAGVVVSAQPLIDTVPLYKVSGREETVTQYNMKEVEEIGLLKIDFLGLKNLTVIEDCVKLVEEKHGVRIDWAEIGLEDEETYELYRRGDGFGVFQVESSGMREMLRKALPTCFEDVVALIALYRPGPMEFIPSFVARKHGREPIEYLHPWMEEPLEDTYGLIIYQEQVMQVASRLAGFSLGQADILRRAMGKKNAEEMQSMRKAFEEGCGKNGIDAGLAGRIFDMIQQFAQYGFNKAHAASYAVVSFRTAYLKAHYPAEFMAALLTNEIRNGASDKLGLYVGVAREMGLKVLQPDVNESDDFFTVVDGDIRFGLVAIKNVGLGPVQQILEERAKNGPFESFQDFCERVDTSAVGVRAVECLILAGAFDELGATRPQLLAVMADALEIGASKRKMRESGQTSLFDMLGDDDPGNGLNGVALPNIPDWTDREKFEKEKELAGIFLSGHPLDRYAADIRSFGETTSAMLHEMEDRTPVSMVGIVAEIKQITTKKGDPMAFVTLEDFEGRYEALFFPSVFERQRHLLFADQVLLVQGKFSKRPEDDEGKVLVDRAEAVEEVRRTRAKFVDMTIRLDALTKQNLVGLRTLLREHKGSTPVRLRLRGPKNEEVVVQTASRFKINPSDEFLKAFDRLEMNGKSLRFAGD